MNNALVPVKDLGTFRLTSLIRPNSALPVTRREEAVAELVGCFDDLIQKTPLAFRDFLLRYFRSLGLPIDYPGLPFWAERAARHVFTIFYPTLRNSDWHNPSPEDMGKVSGHLLALVSHSREGTAVFQRLPEATAAEFRAFFAKIETPLRVLIDEGLRMPSSEAGEFLHGLNHAFGRTFDVVGMPRGWNTNSPVLLGLCMGWRYIVTKSPTLSTLHQQFATLFGRQEIGTEDRVKKICHRLGFRFGGDRAADSQGTTVVLDVPAQLKGIPDK